MAAHRLSIVLPVLNEAAGLGAVLQALAPLRARGAELIVADGGSSDHSAALAQASGAQLVNAARGRALQMNAGAAQARGEVLLFLHADTQLPADADVLIREALPSGSRVWGRFDVAITGRPRMLKLIAALMNLRSRLTGIATGDQAMFVTRAAFEAVGGFPAQPLMEDIEMSRRLLHLSRPACLRAKVQTSGRRWESRGVWRTVLLMWRLRFAYWRGVAPERLAELYR
ncbi:TIGR04283 family arsenosugar biosynthesis glycosyltransferase [Polaromonas sp. YR568]|uniref:TIGR04283 family arsenosugar biosynthesis glycosyltransferase n=1 Tax=Polaromonas sp. YR568 TaxID=1855301 RepID=UPI003137BCD6